jgi:hypothetical protein
MSAFNKNHAFQHAVAIVSAGLQSGTIKLYGPTQHVEAAVKDSTYLNNLINSLADNMTVVPRE